jgi:hypothetical protein
MIMIDVYIPVHTGTFRYIPAYRYALVRTSIYD